MVASKLFSRASFFVGSKKGSYLRRLVVGIFDKNRAGAPVSATKPKKGVLPYETTATNGGRDTRSVRVISRGRSEGEGGGVCDGTETDGGVDADV
jgi:hypothetical protein